MAKQPATDKQEMIDFIIDTFDKHMTLYKGPDWIARVSDQRIRLEFSWTKDMLERRFIIGIYGPDFDLGDFRKRCRTAKDRIRRYHAKLVAENPPIQQLED